MPESTLHTERGNVGDALAIDPTGGESGGELLTLELSDIALRPEWQARTRLSDPAVQRYATAYESGADMPPLTVARWGPEGQGYVLLDGWHRMEALRIAGRTYAPCRVRDGVREHEAAWVAAQSNLRHGVPMKAREMREVFRAYVRAGAHLVGSRRKGVRERIKSYRDMAADMGGTVTHGSIRNWMHHDFPAIARVIAGGSPAAEGPGSYGDASVTGDAALEAGAGEAARMEAAVSSLAAIRAEWQATDDPAFRRQVAAAVYALAEAVREAGMYAPEEPPDF